MPKENFAHIFNESNQHFQIYFQSGLEEGSRFDSQWMDLAYTPTKLEQGTGGKLLWSEMQARMKRFGQGHPREFVEMDAYSQHLVDERKGLGFKCDRDDFNADTIGLLASASRKLGLAAPKSKFRDSMDTLMAGFNTVGFDGATFFSTSHPFKDDNGKTQFQRNRYALPINRGNWFLVYSDLLARRRINGDILQPTEFLTIAGPSKLETLIGIFDAREVDGGTNTTYKLSRYRVNPLLTGPLADTWFVVATDLGADVKPLAYLESERPVLRAILDPTDANVRRTNEYEWILDGKYVIALLSYYCISASRPE